VRTKGTAKKVGLIDAFEDRNAKGYAWNNIMLTKWVDHNQVEHRVVDDYNRNRMLIDLSAQPQQIREIIDATIDEQLQTPKQLPQVGIRLMKFCHLYDLKRILDSIQLYSTAFQARYIP
jgi:hypothetical protein